MRRLEERYAGRRSGLLVLAAVGLFLLAVAQSGFLRDLLESNYQLRVTLPEDGIAGLSEGARVELLGADAGRVERIVFSPDQQFHARVAIFSQFAPYIRQDSQVLIKRQFGIAGASYLEISRGRGVAMDWDYAVLAARADRPPTDNIGELVNELRERIFPLLTNADTAVASLALIAARVESPDGAFMRFLNSLSEITGKLERGEGIAGRLLGDDQLVVELEKALAGASGLMGSLEAVLGNLAALSGRIERGEGAIGHLLTDATLVTNLEQVAASANAQILAMRAVFEDLKAITAGLRSGEGTVGHLLHSNRLVVELEDAVAAARAQMSTLNDLLRNVTTLTGKLEGGEGALGKLLTDDRLVVGIEDAVASAKGQMAKLGQMLSDVAVVTARLRDGEGAAGRLLTDDRLVVELENAIAGINAQMGEVSKIMANAGEASGELAGLAKTMRHGVEGVPDLVENANRAVSALGDVGDEVKTALPVATDAMRRTSDAARDLPLLLSQAQKTLAELEKLLRQLQGNWLLGGGEKAAGSGNDGLSPLEVRP